MSSPFEPETKKGTEETIQAIDRATRWLSRIDTTNDLSQTDADIDVDSVTSELHTAETQLRELYRIRTTEMAIDNFVYNHVETVQEILCGDLDTKLSALQELETYIEDEFGSVQPLTISKEGLVWIVAQEVWYHQEGTVHGMDAYRTDPFTEVDTDACGSKPDEWADGYPLYNRNS